MQEVVGDMCQLSTKLQNTKDITCLIWSQKPIPMSYSYKSTRLDHNFALLLISNGHQLLKCLVIQYISLNTQSQCQPWTEVYGAVYI